MTDFFSILIVLYITLRTVSYSFWEQRKNSNTIGAVSVFFLGMCTLAIVYRFL